MAVTSPQPVAVDAGYAHTERIGVGLLLVGAPILMLGAGILHPPHGIQSAAQYYSASRDHSTRFYGSHTLVFLAATLFVPAVVGLARLVHRSQTKVAFWGCVLSLMGFVGYGALDGIDYMNWVAGKPGTGLDPTVMEQLIETTVNSAAILIPVLAVFSLLPLGLAFLALGLGRAGIMPVWVAWLMPFGMPGVAGRLPYPALLIVSGLALVASFGFAGMKLLRAPNTPLSTAGPV